MRQWRMQTFADYALPAPLLQAVEALDYHQPTPIQAATLPSMLQRQDVIAQAKTGSGKTAAFGLALLSTLQADESRLQALVLCPTRELADQVAKEIRALARFIPNIKILSLCGGIPIRAQLSSLGHEPHIVVGTPGRIEDLLKRKALDLSALRCVVLDEADRMLDMGFIDPIRKILQHAPSARNTWMFSATYPDDIRQISTEFQRTPQNIRITDQHDASVIDQCLFEAEPDEKMDRLTALLLQRAPPACLVFCNTRNDARSVAAELTRRGIIARELHGELDQRDRDETVVQFANGSCPVLVATDVAARGLDIKNLPMVVAYELPNDPAVHIHRIGRTGRAGDSGHAYSLVSQRERPRIAKIDALLETPLRWAPPPTATRATPHPPRMRTLIIDAGRRDKLRPGDILGALTGVGGLSGDDVGKIDIFATRSYAAVARERAKTTLQNLREAKIKGRKFRVRML